ncbi:MAG: thioredoxin family protein [Bacteroidetes bacterium]|nr:thioredoxin family protein [Bacteroidota bacterium]MBL7104533.1 thioredoxin family protein [Bacteroidales bacterium]
MKKFLSLFGLILFVTGIGFTQILDPVKWSFSQKDLGNNEAELVFTASIEKGWHLYSQDIPESPPATIFSFEENDGYKLTGKVTESEPELEYDPNFEMTLKYFSNEAVFKQKVKLLSNTPVTIKGYVNFMCCDNTKCLPPTDVEFEFTVEASSLTPATESSSLWVFFVIAILAGFAGALTPCVYPMIPMTVTFFMNSSKNKVMAKINALFYGFSIIVIYTLIGVLVTVLFGSDAIKDVSAHWITNIIFFLVFALFAASFFGLFEFVLPSSLTNKSDKQVDRGGLIGSFFMALTLVLVSFSCTAPFVGGILVEAASGSIFKPAVGMFGFSLAFALPFTFLAFFPSLLGKMPKSGGWLNSIKVVLGFIILALGMKFLLVPDQVLGWGITREVFIAVWIVLFTLMGFYLLGKIKFSHDSDVPYIGVLRLLLIIVTFTFVVYLIPGMFGAPLNVVSGFLPSESSFDLKEIIRESNKNIVTVSSDNNSTICEEPKYADIFKLPHGLQGYFDYEQGLECAKNLNKPILLDFKGHACVNCKVMEKTVWSDPEVLKRLRNDYTIIALYVDDKTKLPESEWVTSAIDGKVKKTIGKKNADFQITKFNVNAQPYYVLIDHDSKKLTEPMAFNRNVNEFIEFLDKGIENFKNGKHL